MSTQWRQKKSNENARNLLFYVEFLEKKSERIYAWAPMRGESGGDQRKDTNIQHREFAFSHDRGFGNLSASEGRYDASPTTVIPIK